LRTRLPLTNIAPMAESVPAVRSLTAHVVRYDVSRWTVAQGVAPFALLAGIAARRIPSAGTITAALALLVLALFLFLRARRSLGAQTLMPQAGKLRLQESGDELSRQTTSRWTLSGATARLHGRRMSYKLRVAEAERVPLEQALTSTFGALTVTARRGSARARGIAGGVLALGVVALATAIALQSLPLLFVGVLAGIGGGATLGALSQRVMRP
jgi:hypothetical protein